MTPLGDEAFALCRPGFESECAAELLSAVRPFSPGAFARAGRDTGLVELRCPGADVARGLIDGFARARPVFARQIAGPFVRADALPPHDRAGAIAAHVVRFPTSFRAVVVEHCDSEDGRTLARLASRLAGPIDRALRAVGRIDDRAENLPVLHVLLLDGARCLVGPSIPGLSSVWPMGIPRLRLRGAAPSRSARKLEEAFHRFLGERGDTELRPGMVAADLGASPGGWSWVLAQRGLQVIAIDNGPMRVEGPLAAAIEHRREDAFRFRPSRRMDWVTCDLAASPMRVSTLIADWIRNDWCERAVFNLKLPMRQRLPELLRCREVLETAAGGDRIEFAHLYHDRLEVTGFLRRAGPGAARPGPKGRARRPGTKAARNA